MRAARTDANQRDIIAALKKAGASVTSLHRVGGGVPDLLIGHQGRNLLAEVKLPNEASSKLNGTQERWHEEWRGSVHVVRSSQEALALIGVKQ